MSKINPHITPCIICERAFESAANDEAFDTVPHAGTQFTSHGNYGSTVYDPFGGEHLEVNICDPCLLSHSSRIVRVVENPPVRQAPTREPWNPNNEY